MKLKNSTINNLIELITGFKKKDSNYKVCFDYAYSNFKYHSFLDVNSNDINRKIVGLVEKFRINSQSFKADCFEELTGDFLKVDYTLDETRYAIVSLLLCLSNSPTNLEYYPSKLTANDEHSDNFDWTSYLLEDINVEKLYLSEFSSDEEDVFDDEFKNGEFLEQIEAPNDDPPEEKVCERKGDITSLKGLLINAYWNETTLIVDTHCSSYNINLLWQTYLKENSLSIQNDTILTEYQLIREILWLLLGHSSYIFTKVDDIFINRLVSSTHSTSQTICNILKSVTKYGNKILKIQHCIHEILSNKVSQTCEAFAAALNDFLMYFRSFISELEKKISLQESIYTLQTLFSELADILHELDIVYDIFQNSIGDNKTKLSNSHTTCLILDTLHSYLIKFYHLNDRMNLIITLFIKVIKPYFMITDNWMTAGKLIDPMNEYCIKKSMQHLYDETYWDSTFSFQNSHVNEDVDCTQNTVMFESTHGLYIMPKFFIPFMNKVAITGKSMEILRTLTHIERVKNKLLFYLDKISLYDGFLNILKKDFSCDNDIVKLNFRKYVNYKPFLTTNHYRKCTSSHGNIDSNAEGLLMGSNFSSLANSSVIIKKIHSNVPVQQNIILDEILNDAPIQLFMEKCMNSLIDIHYVEISKTLLDVLFEDYSLLHMFDTVTKFYLFGAGDTMYDFYRNLFLRYGSRESWYDPFSLTCLLKESIHARFPNECDHFYISINDKKAQHNNSLIKMFECITLHYTVDWPLSVIFSEKCMSAYNDVFNFLIQAKVAKYSIDVLTLHSLNLHLGCLESNSETTLSDINILRHRLYILKFRFSYLINGIHDNIISTLHNEEFEFHKKIDTASDLEEILDTHVVHMSSLYEKCLLHSKGLIIKDFVLKILNLALTFHDLWTRTTSSISMAGITDIENNLSKCVSVLSSILKTVIQKKGSFLQLESLFYIFFSANFSSN